MTGFGSASPVLELAPLTDDLDDQATVVVVEPFGYPAELPVLAFVAQDGVDTLAEWYPAHHKQLAGLERAELVVDDDGHDLYHHHSPEIADRVRTFLAAPA